MKASANCNCDDNEIKAKLITTVIMAEGFDRMLEVIMEYKMQSTK